jgi:hypothetical protein
MFPKCYFADFTCFIELPRFVYFVSICALRSGIGARFLMNLNSYNALHRLVIRAVTFLQA